MVAEVLNEPGLAQTLLLKPSMNQPRWPPMNHADLLRRAHDAYLRTGRIAGAGEDLEQPDRALSGVRTRKGHIYVVLTNAREVVAVYRVKNDGALRRLRRWPRELETP